MEKIFLCIIILFFIIYKFIIDPQKRFFLIIFILIIYFIFKYSWKIQLHFNSSAHSLYTPETFPVSNSIEYHNKINDGIAEMKKSKVIITGLLRDVENQMDYIKKKIYSLVPFFNDYAIVLVENDSSDNTRKLLLEMADQDSKVEILGCGINVDTCKLSLNKTLGHSVNKNRIDKMTMLRNIYMDHIKNSSNNGSSNNGSSKYNDFDYVIMWDLDLIGSSYIDGIQNTFGHFSHNPHIECICANGVYRWMGFMTMYYDTFAHLEWNDDFQIAQKTKHDIKTGLTVKGKRGDPLQNVRSCFSGFSIYRLQPIIQNNLEYKYTPEDKLLCEHATLNDQLNEVYMNPSMINYVIRNE
jgi:hypothetical protein